MLKAVIFDFDGVIANTEPVHLRAFQTTLEGRASSSRKRITTRITSRMTTGPCS
ncbi:MAG: HAD hydrolase-like protein [Thermodesulfobacteriota bacterium]